MSKSSTTPRERARKIEGTLRNKVQDKGREHLMKTLAVSEGTAAKFMAGDKPDCKINIKSISILLESLGLKVVEQDTKGLQKGFVAVRADLALAGITYSRMGLDTVEQEMIDGGHITKDGALIGDEEDR